MVILDLYGMTFNAVGVFGPDFQLLFKSGSSYCGKLIQKQAGKFGIYTFLSVRVVPI